MTTQHRAITLRHATSCHTSWHRHDHDQGPTNELLESRQWNWELNPTNKLFRRNMGRHGFAVDRPSPLSRGNMETAIGVFS